jgi:hypothetical protein
MSVRTSKKFGIRIFEFLFFIFYEKAYIEGRWDIYRWSDQRQNEEELLKIRVNAKLNWEDPAFCATVANDDLQ